MPSPWFVSSRTILYTTLGLSLDEIRTRSFLLDIKEEEEKFDSPERSWKTSWVPGFINRAGK